MGTVIEFAAAKERIRQRRRAEREQNAANETVWDLMIASDYCPTHEERVELEIPHELLTEIVYQEGRRAQRLGEHAKAIKSFYWVVSNTNDECVRALARLSAANSDFLLAKMTNFKTTLDLVRGGLPLVKENISCLFYVLEANHAWDLSDRKKAFCHFQMALKNSNNTIAASGVRQKLVNFLDSQGQLTRLQIRQQLYNLADGLISEVERDFLCRLAP